MKVSIEGPETLDNENLDPFSFPPQTKILNETLPIHLYTAKWYVHNMVSPTQQTIIVLNVI